MMTTETMTMETIAEMIRAGRHDEAGEALGAFRDTEENSTELQFLRGYLQEMSYDRQEARETYQTVLERDPKHTEAAFRAALLADQSGDDEAAIELYCQCTADMPLHVNALLNLAVLYEEAGDLGSAEEHLNDVLNEYPNHDRATRFLKSVQSSYTMVYDEHGQKERERHDAVLDMPVADFELSVRSRNCLRQMNIQTLGDLLRTTEAELLSYKNFGDTSLTEIKAMLTQKNLKLGQELPVVEQPALVAPAPTETEACAHAERSVAELELSVRSRKALQRFGITTLGELAMRSEAELIAIKNFGQTSLDEIARQLARYGLSLRESAT